MELVERADHLSALDEHLARVRSSRAGRLVLVRGEAGSGKTALVGAFCERHGGVPVLAGACEALFTPRPLGPLLDIAEEAGGELAGAVARGVTPSELVAALARVVRGPRIVVLEDVHWADEATLDVMRLLGRRVSRIPALVLATYRDEDVGRENPLRAVLGELAPGAVYRLSVDPLSEGAVATLAAAAGRDGTGLHARTAGNAFFVTEVLATQPQEGVPPTVRDAVLARAPRIPAAARRVLEAVAVVPQRAEMWLVEVLAGEDLPGLEACISTGLLRDEGAAVAFRHELARVTIESELPPSRRVELHRCALAALDGRAEPARLAHHAEAAGEVTALVVHAAAAGERAAQLGAHRQAAAHFETALRHGDGRAPGERARLHELLAIECYLAGMIPAALDAARAARDAYRAAGDRLKEGESEVWLSLFAWYAGDRARAERVLDGAISVLEELEPSRQLVRAYGQRASLKAMNLHMHQAREWGARCLALAETLGERDIANAALVTVGTAEISLGVEEGVATVTQGLAVALERDAQDEAGVAYCNLASVLAERREYDAAEPWLQEGMAYCDEHDLDSWGTYLSGWKARTDLDRGRWDDAARRATAALDRAGKTLPQSRFTPLLVTGLLAARRGQAGVWTALDEARAIAVDSDELQRLLPAAIARAEAHWLAGSPDRIDEETSAALANARAVAHDISIAELELWRRRAGLPVVADDDLFAPVAAELGGDAVAAADAWERCGCPYEAALALAAAEDEGTLRESHARLVELGARPAAAIVARRLRDRGVRDIRRGPRPATRANAAGLTPRELEILALVAAGERNADIAGRLFLSERTVHHHVAAILRKLEVRTRGQATAEAIRLGLVHGDGRAQS